MNPLLDEDEDDLKRTERELTLSTGMILGIFLVLVLLCGAFFGFGYKMGNHTKDAVPVSTANTDGSQPSTDFNAFKPSAGSPAGGSAQSAPDATPDGTTTTPSTGSSAASEPAPAVVNPAGTAHATEAPAAAQPAVGGSYVVQVAAVSHEEDAQLLVNALKAKGYPVSAHTEAQDKFFHIQVGPYGSMKDATAAKQRLVADGYQPIIK